MYPQSMFWSKNKKNIKKFHLKIIIFSTFRNCCILHEHVFVMDPEKMTDRSIAVVLMWFILLRVLVSVSAQITLVSVRIAEWPPFDKSCSLGLPNIFFVSCLLLVVLVMFHFGL